MHRDGLRARRRTQVLFDAGNLRGLPEKVDWAEVSSRLPAVPASPSDADSKLASTADALAVNSGSKAAKAGLYAREQQGRTVRQIGLSFLGLRPDQNLKEGGAGGLAPGYLLPFEIVSIHLLVVLIGAAYLARAKRRPAVDETVGLG